MSTTEMEENTLDVTSSNGLSVNGLSVNGLSVNGLSYNGLSVNGLSYNGLSVNGLSVNGLSVNGAFVSWFNQNPALCDQTMKYIVRCALLPGHSTSFTDKNGVTHTWAGALGLADSWLSTPPTAAQKGWVSSCLMAHVNNALPTPKEVQISVRGEAPSLATTQVEAAALKTFDGMYFGDLFNSPSQMFICNDPLADDGGSQSRLLADWGRTCGVDGCGIFTKISCQGVCSRQSTGTYNSTCTYNGKSYNAVRSYVPDYKVGSKWVLLNGAKTSSGFAKSVSWTPIVGLSSTANATAKITNWTAVTGNYRLGIRYSATQLSSLNLSVDGGTTKIPVSFPATASADTWANIRVPVTIQGGAMVSFSSPGINKPAPTLDVVWIEVAQ